MTVALAIVSNNNNNNKSSSSNDDVCGGGGLTSVDYDGVVIGGAGGAD